ncbi:hypothetical protein V3472_05980 [Lacticaseibacillus rhamnosus]
MSNSLLPIDRRNKAGYNATIPPDLGGLDDEKQDQAVKKMVAENNELREQLTKENREYYENLLAYLRGKSLLRDDYQVEQNLLTILQDLIDAQADGVDAAAYFGKNPEAIADDLLKTIPLNLTDFFWFNLKMVFMMLFIFWIPQLVRPVMIVDIGMALLCGIIAVIGSWGFFGFWHITLLRNTPS